MKSRRDTLRSYLKERAFHQSFVNDRDIEDVRSYITRAVNRAAALITRHSSSQRITCRRSNEIGDG